MHLAYQARILSAIACAALLAACAPRPDPSALTTVATSTPGSKIERIYVATTRRPAAPPRAGFTSLPSFETTYWFYDISVPPNRRVYHFPWLHGHPNPSREYLVRRSGQLDRRAFLADIRQHNDDASGPGVGIYVHGFNTRFPEALFRLAQMRADGGDEGVPVLFAWPSEGRTTEYVADLRTAMLSRDALAELLSQVAHSNRRVTLVGHSMGAWLSMEALRTLKLSGRRDVLQHLDVVLAAPDIDPYLFREQMRVIGRMRRPLVLLLSKDDRALALSSLIGGRRPRLGALQVKDPRIVAGAKRWNIELIDISSVTADPARHNRYLALAGIFAKLENADRSSDSLRQSGVFVLNLINKKVIEPVLVPAGP